MSIKISKIHNFFVAVLATFLAGCSVQSKVLSSPHLVIEGLWSEGKIFAGHGYYVEENFLSDGRFCAMHLHRDGVLHEFNVEAGTWELTSGTLAITITQRLVPKKYDLGGTEIRELLEATNQTLTYTFSANLGSTKLHRVNSKGDYQWCKALVQPK